MYTLLNPHISDFLAEPVLYKYAKRRPLKKYSYLFTEQIKQKGCVQVLIDSASSGIIPMGIYIKLPFFLRLIISKIEVLLWKKRNNYGNEVQIHFNARTLPDRNALILFAYKNYKNSKGLLKTASLFKHCIVHLSHYHNDTSKLSAVLQSIKNLTLAAEVQIKDIPYFDRFFSWYMKPIFVLPFAVEDRFVKRKSWSSRKNKVLSVGTFHFLEKDYASGNHPELEDFIQYSGEQSLHPLRREVYLRQDELSEFIDCSNSLYIETKKKDSFFKILTPKNLLAGQKKYFSFDIVERFNEYKFVVVGEEVPIGLPGIGTFEALACGCVVIGDKRCYNGIDTKNLILIENLTADKAINVMQQITSADMHICEMYGADNYKKIVAGLKNLS